MSVNTCLINSYAWSYDPVFVPLSHIGWPFFIGVDYLNHGPDLVLTCAQMPLADQLTPSSSDFAKLLMEEVEICTFTTEREKLVGERRLQQKTELFEDEITGEKRFRTVEYIEKTIEHEVSQPKKPL